MIHVTDTHSLVWYFTSNSKLSDKALKTFEQTKISGSILVPVIVLAEIQYISRKGRISMSFLETIEKIDQYANFQIIPLDVETLKIAETLSENLEMHDKLIVSHTLFFNAKLITYDKQLRELYPQMVIW